MTGGRGTQLTASVAHADRRIPLRRGLFAMAAVAVLVAACTAAVPGASGPASSPGVTEPASTTGATPATVPTPGGSVVGTLTAGQLRLTLIDRFGPRWYCDPDLYPVAVADEQARAIARFAEMQAEGDVYAGVVSRLGLTGTTTFTDAQKLAIYQLWKVAVSLPLDPLGDGRYRFDTSPSRSAVRPRAPTRRASSTRPARS